jgi:hypothetical protein
MGTMFKFVASDGIGNSQKRQQSQKACDNCRRRKKRCLHTDSAPQSLPPPTVQDTPDRNHATFQSPQSSASPINVSHAPTLDQQGVLEPQERSKRWPTPNPSPRINDPDEESEERTQEPARVIQPVPVQESQNSRFIGDLNPEGIFLAATSPDAIRGSSGDASIGIWLTTALNRTASQDTLSTSQSQSSIFHGSGSLIQKVLVPMLEQECLATIPPPDSFAVLSKIYFDKVHPVFPVINVDVYNNLPTSDSHRILLQQAICLAASKNFVARPHLLLPDSATPLTCREFGSKISSIMKLSMEIGLVTNKIVMIQALTLMSQFTDNPVGGDLTAQ